MKGHRPPAVAVCLGLVAPRLRPKRVRRPAHPEHGLSRSRHLCCKPTARKVTGLRPVAVCLGLRRSATAPEAGQKTRAPRARPFPEPASLLQAHRSKGHGPAAGGCLSWASSLRDCARSGSEDPRTQSTALPGAGISAASPPLERSPACGRWLFDSGFVAPRLRPKRVRRPAHPEHGLSRSRHLCCKPTA